MWPQVKWARGTVRGTSHEKLYKEAGFISLKNRRERHKLILYFKFVNNLLPEHLNEKFPRLVSETNPYHRRRPLERNIVDSQTELYKASFFPSTTTLWNALTTQVKSLTSISAFKRNLAINDHVVPPYYYIGDRRSQINHARLRLNMSDLNFDLFNRHLSNIKTCICKARQEDASHFLLSCPLYKKEREVTIHVLPPLAQECKVLLSGNTAFSVSFNSYIFLTVQEFIATSGRFVWYFSFFVWVLPRCCFFFSHLMSLVGCCHLCCLSNSLNCQNNFKTDHLPLNPHLSPVFSFFSFLSIYHFSP